MAKKYESDIDPDEFIRSFREEPSGLSRLSVAPLNLKAAIPNPPLNR